MATNENNPCTCTTPEYTIILNQQGPSGRQGATGQNGFSPIIDVSTNTRNTYVLTITTADGVITTPNLKSEPIPSGGTNGQVLTNFGNDVYGWGTLPNATTESQGVVYLSTDEDFQPDEEGKVDDTTACTPQTVVDYVQSVGLPIASTTTLGGIKVGDGLSITDDGVLSASGGGSKIQLKNASDTTNGVKIRRGAGEGVSIAGWNSTILLDSGWNAGRESWAAPYIDFSTEYSPESFAHNYYGRITGFNDGILFSAGDVSPLYDTSRQYYVGVVKISTASGETETEGAKSITLETRHILGYVAEGAEYETVDSQTVLTDKTGIQYKALTSAEYTELQTKSDSTIYKLTDTNEVYLGTIPLTGGASAQYKTLLINNYDNATQTNLGGSTTVQVTDTEV